jgi:hypothetical protein
MALFTGPIKDLLALKLLLYSCVAVLEPIHEGQANIRPVLHRRELFSSPCNEAVS